jgi:hypothetical protein
MIRTIAILAVSLALVGCGVVYYTYEGQKYDSKEEFQQAIDAAVSDAMSTITPLPTALTKRKLVFAIPSESTLFTENLRRFVALNGREPTALQNEMNEHLSRSAYKNFKVFFDAVQKKNIYGSTQLIEMQSMTGSLAASPDADALYLVEPSLGSAQWYYVSSKHGQQIFAYDRSSPTPRYTLFLMPFKHRPYATDCSTKNNRGQIEL